jgi:hypothetical protein
MFNVKEVKTLYLLAGIGLLIKMSFIQFKCIGWIWDLTYFPDHLLWFQPNDTCFSWIDWNKWTHTLSVQNIKNTFLILSRRQNSLDELVSLNSSGYGLLKVSKAFHWVAGPCWLQCFPQLCQVGWMSFGWWTVLDTQLNVKNPAAL